ncbi:MAG: hypothetical protein Q6J33_00040 [Gloeomargarita sp. DG_2_bins_126]
MLDVVLTDRIDSLPVGERWNVLFRLQELSICSECRADGSLDVQVKNSCEAILLCMILARVTTTHAEHLQWLERCWNLSVPPGG